MVDMTYRTSAHDHHRVCRSAIGCFGVSIVWCKTIPVDHWYCARTKQTLVILCLGTADPRAPFRACARVLNRSGFSRRRQPVPGRINARITDARCTVRNLSGAEALSRWTSLPWWNNLSALCARPASAPAPPMTEINKTKQLRRPKALFSVNFSVWRRIILIVMSHMPFSLPYQCCECPAHLAACLRPCGRLVSTQHKPAHQHRARRAASEHMNTNAGHSAHLTTLTKNIFDGCCPWPPLYIPW